MTDIPHVSGPWMAFLPDSELWAVANAQQLYLLDGSEIRHQLSHPEVEPSDLVWKDNDLFTGLYQLSPPAFEASIWMELKTIIRQQPSDLWEIPVQARLLNSQWSEKGDELLLHLGYEPRKAGRARLMTGQGPLVQLVLAKPGHPAVILEESMPRGSVPMAADKNYILRGGRDLNIWKRKDLTLLPNQPAVDGYVYQICLLPSRSEALWAYSDGRMLWYDLDKQEQKHVWQAHKDRIEAMTIHPQTGLVASASEDGWKLWKLFSGEVRLLYENTDEALIDGLTFHPERREIYVSYIEPENRIRIFQY